MSEKEVIHLIGDFRSDVLERWKQFAKTTNRTIEQHTSFEGIQGRENLLIILDEHGLNSLPF